MTGRSEREFRHDVEQAVGRVSPITTAAAFMAPARADWGRRPRAPLSGRRRLSRRAMADSFDARYARAGGADRTPFFAQCRRTRAADRRSQSPGLFGCF